MLGENCSDLYAVRTTLIITITQTQLKLSIKSSDFDLPNKTSYTKR